VAEIVELTYEMFFKRARMRGWQDTSFFEKINACFVCFIVAIIQHCLKGWEEGEVKLTDFTYETAGGKSKIRCMGTVC